MLHDLLIIPFVFGMALGSKSSPLSEYHFHIHAVLQHLAARSRSLTNDSRSPKMDCLMSLSKTFNFKLLQFSPAAKWISTANKRVKLSMDKRQLWTLSHFMSLKPRSALSGLRQTLTLKTVTPNYTPSCYKRENQFSCTVIKLCWTK